MELLKRQTLVNTKPNHNFGLTQEEFEAMAASLRGGDESLFERCFLSRFKPCMSTLTRVYRAPHDAAYDCTMSAMLRMRQLLLDEKVHFGNLESYLTRIAVNEYLKKQERNLEVSTEVFEEGAWDQDLLSDGETLGILDRAWEKLGDRCQELLKGFYYDKIELKKLTELLNDSSEANTRKRKERCLTELRKLFFRFYQ